MRPQGALAASVLILSLVLHGSGGDVPRLSIAGPQFVDEAGRPYIPRWVSGLTLLIRTPAQQASFLDWAAKASFNGVRVFAGALTWGPQTPEAARKALPGLLDRAAARGLVVEVTALTDTGTGYDAQAHLKGVVDILAGRPGVVLELANEVGHPSQAADLTPERLRSWGQEVATPRGVLWSVGAANTDELQQGQYPAAGGSYITVHLSRGGETWRQISRVRELSAIAEAHGVPVINNEPTGADERPGSETGRQRWNDPAAFFALGALDRAAGSGGVHHSQAGLMAQRPGPVQQRCAEAYIAGHRAVEAVLGRSRAVFKQVGRPGAPLSRITGLDAAQVLSFMHQDRAVVISLGASAVTKIEWAAGWKPLRVAATMTGADGRRVDVIHGVKASR